MARKTNPQFDPSELDDLILTPAVGSGVGSHLVKTTEVRKETTTVAISYEATVDKMWITEGGDVLPASRVKEIKLPQDILNAAEQAVYEWLWNLGQDAGESRLVQAGYHPLMKATGLSKKTIQRVVDRLIAKDFIAVEQPADIYERKSTVYRVFDFTGILRRMEERGRLHAARIGPGVVYARPLREAVPRT